MTTITHISAESVRISGEFDCVFVNTVNDEESGGVQFLVINTNDFTYGYHDRREDAIDQAIAAADGELELDDERDEPWDGFNSDAEADADALASAGMGTDEDYGCFGCDDY
jgi:hypothetical protein